MRSFTIVKINSSDRRVKSNSVGGRFQSTDPASAAKKAGSSICRQNNINSAIKFKVAIRETTQGSAHKIFVYSFSRFYNPRIVMRSGKQIAYEFETKVKSLKNKSVRDGNLDFTSARDIVLFDDDKDYKLSTSSSPPSSPSSPPPPPPPPPPTSSGGGTAAPARMSRSDVAGVSATVKPASVPLSTVGAATKFSTAVKSTAVKSSSDGYKKRLSKKRSSKKRLSKKRSSKKRSSKKRSSKKRS